MKLFFVACICLFSEVADAQMKHFFMLLPAECSPELNKHAKEILKDSGVYKTYSIPERFSMNDYSIHDYLGFGSDVTSWDHAGYVFYSLKKLKDGKGDSMLVFSKFSGAHIWSSQTEIRLFDIGKDTLIENKTYNLPLSIDVSEFLKPETPDSIKQEYQIYFSCYDLSSGLPNEIQFKIQKDYKSYNDDSAWWNGDTMQFIWDGKTFTKQLLIPWYIKNPPPEQ